MKNTIGQQISNHLEYLGYETKEVSTRMDCSLVAICDGKPTLTINITADEWVWIYVQYKAFDNFSLVSIEFYKLLNEANTHSAIARWCLDKLVNEDEIIIVVQTWYFGYEKKSFGMVIDQFIKEIFQNMPKLSKLLPNRP